MDINELKKHVLDRQLFIAKRLADSFDANTQGDLLAESGFAILHLCLQYFEFIEQLSTGSQSNGQSMKFFIRGYRRVFGQSTLSNTKIGTIYAIARCGMFHSGIPSGSISIDRLGSEPLTIEQGVVVSNPIRLVDLLIRHFSDFIYEIQSNPTGHLRYNAKRFWDHISIQCDSSIKPGTTKNPADQN